MGHLTIRPMLQLLLWALALLAPFVGAARSIIDTETPAGFLTDADSEHVFAIRNPVDLLLVGLPSVGADSLRQALEADLAVRQPRVVGSGAGAPLRVAYELEYRVFHASQAVADQAHQLVGAALAFQRAAGGSSMGIELSATLERQLEALAEAELKRQRGGDGVQRVVVLNLERARLAPAGPLTPGYGYRYRGQGPVIASWLSSARSAWIDVGSGVAPEIIPQDFPRLASASFMADLASAVRSVVESVFCPDLARAVVDVGERVMLQLQPLGEDSSASLDASQLRRQLEPLASGPLPIQVEVKSVPPAARHDSPEARSLQLFALVQQSLRQRRTPLGAAVAEPDTYLDADRMLGLLQAGGFVSPASVLPADTTSLGLQVLRIVLVDLPSLWRPDLRTADFLGLSRDGATALIVRAGASQGTGHSPLQLTMAAALRLMGAVVPPNDVGASPDAPAALWSAGCHPFGVAGVPEVGQLAVDAVLRNSIVSRVDRAYRTLRGPGLRMAWLHQAHGLPGPPADGEEPFQLPPDAPAVVARAILDFEELRERLRAFEERFRSLSVALFRTDLGKAFRLAAQLSVAADAFEQHAGGRLEELEAMLGCVGNVSESTNWVARLPRRDLSAYLALGVALVVLALLGGIIAWIQNRRLATELGLVDWKRE